MQQTSTNDRPHGGSVPHASGKLYQKFLSYYRSQWHLFAVDSVAAVVMTAVDLAFPIILRELTGGLFTQGAGAIMGALGTLALGLIAMYAVRYACRYFVGYWGHVMGARMESRMRQDLFDQYERFSFSYYDRHNTGDLMSRVVSDLFDICEAAHHGPEYAIICGIKIVGSFAILATINWKLSCVLAVITAVLWAYNSRANKRMRAVFMENRKRISGINSQLEDSLSGIRVVKGFAAEDVEREKFARSNEAYLESKQRMYHVMGGYQAMIAALMGALFTVVIVYGGYLIAVGEMQPVDLSTYALYITTFTAAIEQLGELGLDIPVAGLAKSDEELFVPWDEMPVVLPSGSASLYLVKRVRDEAHRFAITFHRELRDKAMTVSILDEIPGVGEKRKRALRRAFGSMKRLREASEEDIAAVPGIPAEVAREVYETLRAWDAELDSSREAANDEDVEV